MPLRAWPLSGGKKVPEIYGLDEYGYDVGAALAARAEARFANELAQESAVSGFPGKPPNSHEVQETQHRPTSATGAFGSGSGSIGRGIPLGPEARKHRANQCFIEAGGLGNSVILWNSAGQPSDDGHAQIQARRQKLTVDMLKEIVVSYGDSFKAVSWWFRVFEFYCDHPVDMALPALPEAFQEIPAAKRSKSQPRLASRRPSKLSEYSQCREVTAGFAFTSSASVARLSDSAAGRARAISVGSAKAASERLARPVLRGAAGRSLPRSRDSATARRTVLPESREVEVTRARPASASTLLTQAVSGTEHIVEQAPRDRSMRPRLRLKPSVPRAPRLELNETLWVRRQHELKRLRRMLQGLPGADLLFSGDLDLMHKCKVDHLDDEHFMAWVSGYTSTLHKTFLKLQRSRKQSSLFESSDSDDDVWGDKRECHLSKAVDRMRDHMKSFDLSALAIKKQPDKVEKQETPDDSEDSDDGRVVLGGQTPHDGVALALGSSVLDMPLAIPLALDPHAPLLVKLDPDKGAATELDTTAIFLRTASQALLSSKLFHKPAEVGSQQYPQHGVEDILERRAEALASIKPVHMSPDNLFQVLSVFGLARRKTLDMVFDFLVTSSQNIGPTQPGAGLQFEMFYCFMRALLGGHMRSVPRKSRKIVAARKSLFHNAAPESSVDWQAAARTWQDSNLLMRLMFSLLTGRVSITPSSAAERRIADNEGIAFPLRQLSDSLRLLICSPVLKEFDRSFTPQGSHCVSATSSACDALAADTDANGIDRDSDGNTGDSGAHLPDNQSKRCHPNSSVVADTEAVLSMLVRSRRGSLHADSIGYGWFGSTSARTQFAGLAECLHTELLHSEAKSPGTGCEDLSQSPTLSFAGWSHFVSVQPAIFVALVNLFLPLISRGAQLVSEEIDLTNRKLMQRAGELRARMEVQVQRLQRKQMARLHQEFTQPFLEGKTFC